MLTKQNIFHHCCDNKRPTVFVPKRKKTNNIKNKLQKHSKTGSTDLTNEKGKNEMYLSNSLA